MFRLRRISSAMPSRTASSQPVSTVGRVRRRRGQRLRRVERIGEDVKRVGRRARARASGGRSRSPRLDGLVDRGVDLVELAPGDDRVVLEDPPLEGLDRAALRPGIDLVLRAVDPDDRVALVMSDGAVGLGLDQRRPLARAAPARPRSASPARPRPRRCRRPRCRGCRRPRRGVAISGLSVTDDRAVAVA